MIPELEEHNVKFETKFKEDCLECKIKKENSMQIFSNRVTDDNKAKGDKNDKVRLIKYEHRKESYVPPLNFSLVEDSIYRSGFPMPINYQFLEQLGLKTILYMGDLGYEKKEKKKSKSKDGSSPEKIEKKDKNGTAEIMDNYKKWISTTDITFHHLFIESSQEPFNSQLSYQQSERAYNTALELILNKQNYPMLIHSNKGKHRVGLLVGLMRKLFQGWCLSGIFEEYEKFAMGKSEFDLECIELFQPEIWYDEDFKPDFIRI